METPINTNQPPTLRLLPLFVVLVEAAQDDPLSLDLFIFISDNCRLLNGLRIYKACMLCSHRLELG